MAEAIDRGRRVSRVLRRPSLGHERTTADRIFLTLTVTPPRPRITSDNRRRQWRMGARACREGLGRAGGWRPSSSRARTWSGAISAAQSQSLLCGLSYRHTAELLAAGASRSRADQSATGHRGWAERPSATGPGQVQVAGIGFTGRVEADLVEPGELMVIACHHRSNTRRRARREYPHIALRRLPCSRMSTGAPVRRLWPHPNGVPIRMSPSRCGDGTVGRPVLRSTI